MIVYAWSVSSGFLSSGLVSAEAAPVPSPDPDAFVFADAQPHSPLAPVIDQRRTTEFAVLEQSCREPGQLCSFLPLVPVVVPGEASPAGATDVERSPLLILALGVGALALVRRRQRVI